MPTPLVFLVLLGLTFAIFWATGRSAVRNLVIALEGTSEFAHGSTSRLRRAGGYTIFAIWLILATLPSSFLADWAWHGDPEAAMARLWLRLEIAVHILEALGDE